MKDYPLHKFFLMLVLYLSSATVVAIGVEYTPQSDDEVLVELPTNFSRLSREYSRQVMADITESSTDINKPIDEFQATALINEYLRLARATADDRYIAYAKQIASNLPKTQAQQDSLNIGLQLALANLAQREHNFSQALNVLDNILKAYPKQGQAHLMAAYIKMAMGNATEALSHCAQASQEVGLTFSLSCSASANSLLGNAERSFRQLSPLANNPTISEAERKETLLSLAEIAYVRGEYEQAQSYFRQGLVLSPEDPFLTMRLADMLIANGDYQACKELLQNNTIPSLQLRLSIAQIKSSGAAEPQLQQSVARYFSNQRLLNNELSTRDYSEYLLNIRNDSEQALQVALANWQEQREPADTELALRAAIADKNSTAAQEVIKWVNSSGFDGYAVKVLIEKIEAGL